MVYFIRCKGTFRVKIGFCKKDPEKRMRHIQVGCPFKLELIGYVGGEKGKEAEYHSKYRQYRCNGEWFDLPPLEIEQLQYDSIRYEFRNDITDEVRAKISRVKSRGIFIAMKCEPGNIYKKIQVKEFKDRDECFDWMDTQEIEDGYEWRLGWK